MWRCQEVVGKSYHFQKNKHLFFANYLMIQKYAIFFLYQSKLNVIPTWILDGLKITFLGRISKWGSWGGIFCNLRKIYTPVLLFIKTAEFKQFFYFVRLQCFYRDRPVFYGYLRHLTSIRKLYSGILVGHLMYGRDNCHMWKFSNSMLNIKLVPKLCILHIK